MNEERAESLAAGAAEVGVPPRRQLLPAFGYRDFRILLIGFLFAMTGFWAQIVALGWLVLRLTDSPFQLTLVVSAGQFSFLLFALYGGVLADRLNRRKLIIFSRLGTTVLMVLLAILTITGVVEVWQIFLIAFVSGSLHTLDLPARNAMIPELVGEQDLMNAISLTTAVLHGTRIVGPAIAGIVVGLSGERGEWSGFILLAGANLIFVAAILLIKGGERRGEPKRTAIHRDLLEGLQLIKANRDVFALVILASGLSIFSMAYFSLMPVFARDVLGGTARELGILIMATGVGALLAMAGMTLAGNFQRKGVYTLIGSLLFGLFLILFSQSTSYSLSIVLLALTGLFNAVYTTIINALLLLLVPRAYHGRIMSVFMITFGFSAFGNIAAGFLAESSGAPFAIAITGLVTIGISMAVFLYRPSLWKV